MTWHPDAESMVRVCDVVTINAPLHPETEHLFDDELISKMKRGAYLINTARGKICDRDAIVRALESGQLAGYAGDVWFPQPPPQDHPWRTMPHHGMTPHTSGTSLSAQARYAAGTREILECWFDQRPIRDEYLIVDGGALAGAGHTHTAPATPRAAPTRPPSSRRRDEQPRAGDREDPGRQGRAGREMGRRGGPRRSQQGMGDSRLPGTDDAVGRAAGGRRRLRPASRRGGLADGRPVQGQLARRCSV